MKKKNIGFDGFVYTDHEISKMKFNGYQVIYQPSGCLWRITELKNSVNSGLVLSFWPRKYDNVPLSICYHPTNLYKLFNNKGESSSISYEFNGSKYGESYKGTERLFFYDDEDITHEVLKIIDNRLVLTDEDKFNLYVKYGTNFKLYEEYNYNIDYDSIIKLCTK